jgi:hypothetical protein
MRPLAVPLLLCAAACSGSGPAAADAALVADGPVALADAPPVPDARADALPPDANITLLTCGELQMFARSRVMLLSTDCNDVNDCDSLGYQFTCNGYVSLTGMGCDITANKAAIAGDDELRHAAFLIAQRCSCERSGCIYDCAPSMITCDDHHCVGHAQTCTQPADAGP